MSAEQIANVNAQKRRQYRAHAQEISAKNNGPNGWKARHREYVAALQKEYRLRMLQADPDWERRAAYKKRYGITLEQYNKMLAAQSHCCAICAGPPRGRDRFHVDHDHQTGAIRALLCWRCNSVLGNLEERADVLQRMIDYLNAHGPAGKANHGRSKSGPDRR